MTINEVLKPTPEEKEQEQRINGLLEQPDANKQEAGREIQKTEDYELPAPPIKVYT